MDEVSSNPTPDRRILRTRQALAEALLALTLERGFADISIRDITERAQVGYATFFRHYPSKEALLFDLLEVVLNELLELLWPQRNEPQQSGVALFRFVAEHEQLCRVLLSSSSSVALMQRIYAVSVQNALEVLALQPADPARLPLELAAHHMVMSTIELLRWWLNHDQPYPPEYMGKVHAGLIVQPSYELRC